MTAIRLRSSLWQELQWIEGCPAMSGESWLRGAEWGNPCAQQLIVSEQLRQDPPPALGMKGMKGKASDSCRVIECRAAGGLLRGGCVPVLTNAEEEQRLHAEELLGRDLQPAELLREVPHPDALAVHPGLVHPVPGRARRGVGRSEPCLQAMGCTHSA